jgi:hypothetical protein
MEADWGIEIGGDAPLIVPHSPDFVDLQLHPEKASNLPETREFRALAAALVRLNARTSDFWTAKCDVWLVEQFDPDELDAPRETAVCAVACYIDLLPRDPARWRDREDAIQWCRDICARLHASPLRCCRADLIVRRALIAVDSVDLGTTVYLIGCGSTRTDTDSALGSALAAFADAIASATAPF